MQYSLGSTHTKDAFQTEALTSLANHSMGYNKPGVEQNKKIRIKYKIEFPPGSMGLELEPVIKSSEREIGCRVKDYYFSIDHCGIDQAYLESRVSIGDIICAINGEDIRSLPFLFIVDRLKSIKDSKRVITFKNITASWISRGSSIGIMDEPSLPISPAPTSQRQCLKAPLHITNKKDSSNTENDSDPTFRLQKMLSSEAGKTRTEPKLSSTKESPHHQSGRRSLTLMSPSKLNIPASDRSIASKLLSSNQKETPLRSQQSIAVVNSLPNRMVGNLDILDSNASDLSHISSNYSSFVRDQPKEPTAVECNGINAANDLEDIPLSPILKLKSSPVEVNSLQKPPAGSSIQRLVGTLSTALEKQTTEVISDLIPVYSEREMQEVLQQKNTLLAELSECLLVLGRTEEKAKQIEAQLSKTDDFHRLYHEVKGDYEVLQTNFDTQTVKLQKYEAEIAVFRQEKLSNDSLIERLSQELKECQTVNHQSLREIDEFQKRILALEEERETEKRIYKETVTKMCEEQRSVRQELAEACEKAEEKIARLEADQEKHKEQISTHLLEIARYKECNEQLLVQKKDLLIESDTAKASFELRIREISEQREKAIADHRALLDQHEALCRDHQECKVKLLVLEQEKTQYDRALEAKEVQYQSLMQLKRATDHALQEKSILFDDLQQRLSLLEDQKQFSSLSLQAQIQEITDLKSERESVALDLQKAQANCAILQKALHIAVYSLRSLRDQLQDVKDGVITDKEALLEQLKSWLVSQVLVEATDRISNLTLKLAEKSHLLEGLQTSLELRQGEFTRLTSDLQRQSEEKDRQLSGVSDALSKVQLELEVFRKTIEELRQDIASKEESLSSVQKEKEDLEKLLTESKMAHKVESAQTIQLLNSENQQLRGTVQEKVNEINSLAVLLQNSKDIFAKESEEHSILRSRYDDIARQMAEQEKVLKDYRDAESQKADQEKKLSQRLSLLLNQLQEKEACIQRHELTIKGLEDAHLRDERKLEDISAKYSEASLLLERQDVLHQAQVAQNQHQTQEFQPHVLYEKETIDHLSSENRSLKAQISSHTSLLSRLQEQVLPRQFSYLRGVTKDLKDEHQHLQALHSHIIQSYKEKIESLERKITLQQQSLSSHDHQLSLLQSQTEKRQLLQDLDRVKEESRAKIQSLEKDLLSTEAKCLHLTNRLEQRESNHLEVVREKELESENLKSELRLMSDQLELQKAERKSEQERWQALIDQTAEEIRHRHSEEIARWQERENISQQKISDLLEAAKLRDEGSTLAKESFARLEQRDLERQDQILKLNTQIQQLSRERKELLVQIQQVEKKVQEEKETVLKLHQQHIQHLNEEWERQLQEKQSSFALELSWRDRMIEEMEKLAKENNSMQAETMREAELLLHTRLQLQLEIKDKDYQNHLLRQHRQVLALRDSHRRLREEIVEILASQSLRMSGQSLQDMMVDFLRKATETKSRSLEKVFSKQMQDKEEQMQRQIQSLQLDLQKQIVRIEQEWKLRLQQAVEEEKERVERDYEATIREMKNNLLRFSDNFSQLNRANEVIVAEKSQLADQCESLQRRYLEVQREKEELLTMHVTSLSEREAALASEASWRDKVDQLEKEKNSKNSLVQSLRDTIKSLQDALSVASSREMETKNVIEQLNHRIFERERESYSLQRELKSLFQQHHAAQKELCEQRHELAVFHQSLHHLVRCDAPPSHLLPERATTSYPDSCEHYSEEDKENRVPLSDLSSGMNKPMLEENDNMIEVEEENVVELYHDQMVYLSLDLHQTISKIFSSLSIDSSKQHPNSFANHLHQEIIALSVCYDKLHRSLLKAPYLPRAPEQPILQLTPPRLSYSASVQLPQQEARLQPSAIAPLPTVEKNDDDTANYGQVIDSCDSLAPKGVQTIDPMVELATVAAVESTEELIRRIDFFLSSVKTISEPKAQVEDTDLSNGQELDRLLSDLTSLRMAEEVESQDRVRLHDPPSTESEFNGSDEKSERKEPGDIDAILTEESCTSDFWNVSTDEEPSLFVDMND